MRYIAFVVAAAFCLSGYEATAMKAYLHKKTWIPIHLKWTRTAKPPTVVRYVILPPDMPNMYVERGREPVYDYMSLQDPRYNPALRDAGGG